jgi:hypothetical protein
MERFYTGPFEGPPTIKPPALPGDIYFQSLPGLIPHRLRRKVKSGFQDTSPLAARSFITCILLAYSAIRFLKRPQPGQPGFSSLSKV